MEKVKGRGLSSLCERNQIVSSDLNNEYQKDPQFFNHSSQEIVERLNRTFRIAATNRVLQARSNDFSIFYSCCYSNNFGTPDWRQHNQQHSDLINCGIHSFTHPLVQNCCADSDHHTDISSIPCNIEIVQPGRKPSYIGIWLGGHPSLIEQFDLFFAGNNCHQYTNFSSTHCYAIYTA